MDIKRYFDDQILTAQKARKLYQDGAAERTGIERESYLAYADAQATRETLLREVYNALKGHDDADVKMRQLGEPVMDELQSIKYAAQLVLEGFACGIFVRDITFDDKPDWAIRFAYYINGLANLARLTTIAPPMPPTSALGGEIVSVNGVTRGPCLWERLESFARLVDDFAQTTVHPIDPDYGTVATIAETIITRQWMSYATDIREAARLIRERKVSESDTLGE